jgi:hypothetical protein
MFNEFDHIAKKLWFADGETIRLVKAMRREDRESVNRRSCPCTGAASICRRERRTSRPSCRRSSAKVGKVNGRARRKSGAGLKTFASSGEARAVARSPYGQDEPVHSEDARQKRCDPARFISVCAPWRRRPLSSALFAARFQPQIQAIAMWAFFSG